MSITAYLLKWNNSENVIAKYALYTGTDSQGNNIPIASVNDLLNYISKSTANGQTIAATSSDTPIYLKGNTGSTYLGFIDSNGTTLGYIGVNSSKKPVFGNSNIVLDSDLSNYVTTSDLTGYATQTWVGNNYIPITGASGIGALTPTGNGTTDFGGSSNRWHYGYFRRLLAVESISNGTSYDTNNMITVPTGAGTMITDFNIGSYAITSLDSCIRTSSSGMQLITCTGTDTPLRLKGSTGDTYLEFLNSSGDSLGFFAVLNTHKPSFYYGGNHEIALTENLGDQVTFSLSGTELTITRK